MKQEFSDHLELPDLSDISNEKIHKALLKAAFDNNLPVAWWRLPLQKETHLVVSINEPRKVKIDLEELPEGFIFAPFSNESTENALFISADVSFHGGRLQINYNKQNAEKSGCLHVDRFLKSFNQFLAADSYDLAYYVVENGNSDSTEEEYIDAVSSAVEEINKGYFQKVVLSKAKQIDLPKALDVSAIFQRLCAKHQNAFISFVSTPDSGTWMGASPEILISVNKELQFHTVAMAGTQQINPETNLKKVAWTEKEIEEQAMVSRYIINCFKKIRLREYDEQGPRTAKAGSLAHLRSDFRVDMAATNFLQLGTVMLELLHPTSAVCGMPKEAALEFILKHEHYDRQFYSGYLGPVNVNRETYLFVNLRCMQLLDNKAILYAGAGITADSDATSEWAETEIKCNTMLSILQ